jgi:ribonuclease HI
MSSTLTPNYTIYTDGASRGNPGPAAYAFVIFQDHKQIYSEKGYLGITTNNQAEYSALLHAWKYLEAKITSEAKIQFFSDSELMVRQLNKEYRVKDANIQAVHQNIQKLSSAFKKVTYSYVPRSENQIADQLCNDVLDSL